jgi:aspartyl-tRNA(Asn)/glutamyl-tRNA(Gln) amidotransferase subunit C
MSLTLSDVQRIARLARLALGDAEARATLDQLNGIFGLIETMQAVDTQGIEPLATPLAAIEEVSLRLREDAITEPNDREAYQESAPAVRDGLYLVPKVIE